MHDLCSRCGPYVYVWRTHICMYMHMCVSACQSTLPQAGPRQQETGCLMMYGPYA